MMKQIGQNTALQILIIIFLGLMWTGGVGKIESLETQTLLGIEDIEEQLTDNHDIVMLRLNAQSRSIENIEIFLGTKYPEFTPTPRQPKQREAGGFIYQ